MTIKAIETSYLGYKFRSRLEARWAVYFSEIGIGWDYEPEGYDLGAAGWYLPDFYLPDLDAWIEIKPFRGSKPDVRNQLVAMIENGPAEKDKAWSFFGDPLDHWWMMPVKYEGVWRDEWPQAAIEMHRLEGGNWAAWPGFSPSNMPDDFGGPKSAGAHEMFIGNYLEKVKARSARFEHGQSGATL